MWSSSAQKRVMRIFYTRASERVEDPSKSYKNVSSIRIATVPAETNLCFVFAYTPHHCGGGADPAGRRTKPRRQVDVTASKAGDPVGTALVTTATLEVHAVDANSIKKRTVVRTGCVHMV